MNLPRRVVFFVLCVLFVAAIAARVSTTSPQDSPYFKGASAMAYRHALRVANGGALADHDVKAGHPEGYVPARYRAAGAETITGQAYRVFGLVSNIDGRPFTRRMLICLASLCVFTAYAVASRLWSSRAAGFLAAFLVVFLFPLAQATNGRTFSHVIFAAFFASLYAAMALRSLPRSSPRMSVTAALLAWLLLWVWEPARYGLAVWVVAATLAPPVDRRTRIWFVLSHAVVIVAGVVLIPHLAAVRALGSWTTAVVIAAAAAAVLPDARRRGWRPAVWAVAGAAVLTLLATPLRAGASEQYPALEYVWTRIRFMFGRPDASLLSDWMRHLWSEDHAPLPIGQAIPLLLPLLLCALAFFSNRRVRAGRTRFAATTVLLLVAAAAVMLDQSILPAAALAMIVVASGAAVEFDSRRWTQSIPVGLGAYLALAGIVLAGKSADVGFRLAQLRAPDPSQFVWMSFENTDRELVRFIATRTSVSECILAPQDLSALLLTFSGRTSPQLAGATSRDPALRHVELARAMYRDEVSLYELCRRDQIDYVVYSIDILLDGGPYSPSSLAAVSALDPSSVAARMHFDPESLRHFTLMYQNDHYRLFRVTETAQPVFLTDHPLFYQASLFARDGADLDHFRAHVTFLMLTYAGALDARARGDAEKARRMLDLCVRQAPRFTRARLALADALMDLGRYEPARKQIAAVMEYAPDNPAALYAAAWVQVQLGNEVSAKPFLELLQQTGDPKVIEKGRALQYYLDNGIPIKPGSPP